MCKKVKKKNTFDEIWTHEYLPHTRMKPGEHVWRIDCLTHTNVSQFLSIPRYRLKKKNPKAPPYLRTNLIDLLEIWIRVEKVHFINLIMHKVSSFGQMM